MHYFYTQLGPVEEESFAYTQYVTVRCAMTFIDYDDSTNFCGYTGVFSYNTQRT